jgi:hypothetical protein
MVPSPTTWVAAAVRHIGYEVLAFPYAWHAIMTCVPHPIFHYDS